MTFRIQIFILLIFLVAACSVEKKTNSGYTYVFYKDQPGKKGTAGDFVYFNFDILAGDSIVQSYQSKSFMPNVLIYAEDSKEFLENPILEVMTIVSEGDSIGLFMHKDSIPGLPPYLQEFDLFEYRMKVHHILSPEQNQQRLDSLNRQDDERKRDAIARSADVLTLLNKTLDEYRSGALKDKLIQAEEGLEYIIHEEGNGPLPKDNQAVRVQYYGVLLDGSSFDNSFRTGDGFSFTLGREEAIRGWDVGIKLLKQGTKATLFIPADLAYGAQGRPPQIQPNTDLIFYVELETLFD